MRIANRVRGSAVMCCAMLTMKNRTYPSRIIPSLVLASLGYAAGSASATTVRLNVNSATWDTTSTGIWVNGTGGALTFTNGDTAVFSHSGITARIVTLGQNINAGNIRSNNTVATINGAEDLTLTLGSATAGTGNLTAATGSTTSSYLRDLTYNGAATGTTNPIFALAPGSGTAATPSVWNMGSTGSAPSISYKTFLINAGATGQVVELNSNVISLGGVGTVKIQGGATVQNGTFKVNSGVLSFAGSSSRNTTVENSVTVNVANGAALNVSANNAGGSAFNQKTVLAAGATLRMESGTSGQHTTNSGLITVNGAASIVNAATAADFNIAGAMDGAGSVSVSNSGTGSTTFSGTNTFTGNTTVASGKLTLADNAGLKFVIGDSGVNNGILGAGTLQLDGDFTFDLTSAASSGTWQIVSNSTLTETYSSTFSVAGFTDNGNDTWSSENNGVTYTFSETTGVLTAVPEPAGVLLGGLGLLALLRRRRHRVNAGLPPCNWVTE